MQLCIIYDKSIVCYHFICDEFASELVVIFRNPQRKRKKTDYSLFFFYLIARFQKLSLRRFLHFPPRILVTFTRLK